MFSVVNNLVPVGLTNVLRQNTHLRPGKPGAHQRVLASKPDLTSLHSHAYLLVNVDQSLLSSLPRHHHGHLYQPSAHRYLLANNHVLRHTAQSISNTLDRRIHNRRDRNLKRRLSQSARLLAADTVTPHLQHITRRGHHIRDKHHMPNINIQPLLLQHTQRLLDNDIPRCLYPEYDSGLVNVIAHSPGRIHSRNLQSESETRALSPDNPFALLLNHQRTLHSRNTLDMGNRQLPGEPSELGNLKILSLDLHRIRFNLNISVRESQCLPDLLNRNLPLPHRLRIQLNINPHPSNIRLKGTRDISQSSMSQERRNLLSLLPARTMLRFQKDCHVRC